MDDRIYAHAAVNAKKRQHEEKKRKSVAKDFRDNLIQTALSRLIMGEMSSEV
jgi:hypothetical protein